jgi:hypothetical protein
MERLERDLRFFEQQLARERDPFLRLVILGQIRDVKEQKSHLLEQQVAQLEEENKSLDDAIQAALKAGRKKK